MVVDLYLNAKYVGGVDNAKDFINKFKNERRAGIIPGEVNVEFDEEMNEIYMDTTRGRARRPLIIVENAKSKLTEEMIQDLKAGNLKWDRLVKDGVLEYLDAAEEEISYIAAEESELTEEHTHLEIGPVTILGLLTSMIPYSNFGGSSRLIRGSKIQKQALGVYASNFLSRIGNDTSVLQYPQKPITKTFMSDVFQYDKHPAGQNVVIAVMSYEGYNMDDAIIMNKSSVDRGLARSFYFKPMGAEERRYQGGLSDEIAVPDKEVKGYRLEKDYRMLEDDGIIYPGAKVGESDVIIGKSSPPRFLGDFEEFNVAANIKRESSIALSPREHGVIDTIMVTENEDGNKLVRIRIREQRLPEIGDKFASRHGQKGIISYLVPQENLPFTATGVTPDLIFSPHGIPSRMTVSHMIEIIAGKVGALSGEYIEGTAFDSTPEKDLRKTLKTLGFRENGTECMYNGLTGEQYKAKIYVGNIYYLKLKHMVANKLHARATGQIQLLTRQPIEGRAHGGGLRVGEMEKDCLVAHGASLLLKERFDSDKAIVQICESCGSFGFYDTYKNRNMCPRCGGNTKISNVEIAYAFKLLIDELKSLGIFPKISTGVKY
jgi:DNA-directed RNA polymerase subunit B'